MLRDVKLYFVVTTYNTTQFDRPQDRDVFKYRHHNSISVYLEIDSGYFYYFNSEKELNFFPRVHLKSFRRISRAIFHRRKGISFISLNFLESLRQQRTTVFTTLCIQCNITFFYLKGNK